uniref:Uncharacterized protein n=1 Tax=Anguilla anguilla TaxID=7936 RepID=A0A0E9VCP4_ANGAN
MLLVSPKSASQTLARWYFSLTYSSYSKVAQLVNVMYPS